jgi:protein phosphatase 1D
MTLAGDLWSYNSEEDVFVVSPEPDTYVYPIDITKHRCLILGTDGAWNMLTPAQVRHQESIL